MNAKKRKNIENNTTNEIFKKKSMEYDMNVVCDYDADCESDTPVSIKNDIIEGIENINIGSDLLSPCFVGDVKNIVYDVEIKSYRLDKMYEFNLINFIKEIDNIDGDVDKIRPLKELIILVSLCFFGDKITKAIRDFLKMEKNINILEKRNIEIHADELIDVMYSEDYIMCDLRLNTDKFWFFSPSRFCHEFIEKIKKIKTSNKIIIKNKILDNLEQCIDRELVSVFHKNETLGWIGFYRCCNTSLFN
jgi:hypothetical protein